MLVFESGKPLCGDGRVEGGEQCDDGNTNPQDGCDPGCSLEISGVVTPPSGLITGTVPASGHLVVAVDLMTPGQSIQARAAAPASGGCPTVDTAIELLDSNLVPLGERLDGGPAGAAGTCAALDPVQDGFAANLAPGRYYLRVRAENGVAGTIEVSVGIVDPACGNRIVETLAQEQCDDGNLMSLDGCSATCRIESSQIAEVEPNDTQATAFGTGLTGPGQVTIQGGTSPAGDDDVFSFFVPAGQTLMLNTRTFSTQGQPMSCNSQTTDTRIFLEHAGLEVTDPSQPGAVAFNDDIDNPNNIWCSEITNVPLFGGVSGATFHIRVQGWRDVAVTSYFLRVQLSP